MSPILDHVVTGSHSDLALLLIHPLGSDLTFWDDLVAEIDGRIATIACTLRGADQAPAQGLVTLAEHTADLEALRDHLDIDSVVPVGCAIGTMLAAHYAATHPGRTKALVLANPTPCSSPQARIMLTERAALVRREGMQSILPGAVERAFVGQPHDERYEKYLKQFSALDGEAYALSILAAAEFDASEALSTLRCPTLLVPGRHDMLLPMERAEAVAALLPRAEIVVLEDGAHFGPYQQPQKFAELALDFIGRQPRSNLP